MADDKPAVFLHMEPGTPTFGVWCPHCLLPSAVSTAVNILWGTGVTTLGVLTLCEGCGCRW